MNKINRKEKKKIFNVRNLVFISIYLSLFLLAGLTGYFGYIPILHTTITYLPVIVVIATIHLEFKGALVSGLGFGFSSLIAAYLYGSTRYQYIDISVLPRLLMAIFVFLAYKLVNYELKPKLYKFIFLSLLATELNVILTISAQYVHNIISPLRYILGVREWAITHVINLVSEPILAIFLSIILYRFVNYMRKKYLYNQKIKF
ncbi:Substrate-specific component PanT of predicted [Mycoplasmopsis meleagridis]|uniref:Substrate-specific component PanT of predictedpantothenate ECF transporter n=1 Tax=Mycoplasmopsis meleagridis ATCC 25294 TaxID=1264554 RepID=A0A0F5H069_9BACT|nr:hypothetical protein [Mycoplasmopsis meleagridis]KKB26716.1 Substrate-specific component PanT of predictedpantothenate ECF transporter [Mycoplasmopsis meleagridis ATCC 25294]OAD18168.1 Substrate-specific component PanT of predicted [Mycoplasmopsis meleagridis]VEU77249.1 Predicted membrane protein [Mycoplasmopsis meleagridis]